MSATALLKDGDGHRTYDSVDAALGPAEGRYFGLGLSRVHHVLHDVSSVGGPGSGQVAARAGIVYPPDWSVKGVGELRPHLSSIDALVLAVRVAEFYMRTCGLSEDQVRRAWIRSMKVRAGNDPTLELSDFAVDARLVASEPVPRSLGGQVSTVESHVGAITLVLEIEHEPRLLPRSEAKLAPGARFVSPPRFFYGDQHRETQRLLADLDLDLHAGSARSLVTITAPEETDDIGGLGAAYAPGLSIVDMIAVAAQMAQALLYDLDGLTRQESQTLWMRRYQGSLKTPYQPITNPFIATTSIRSSRLVPMGGLIWRTAELQFCQLGAVGTFSVAHALPAASDEVAPPHPSEDS